MKKVWIVEQGRYSDYHVVGAFSSKENAEEVAAAINAGEPYDEATTDEWTLDPAVNEIRRGYKQFHVDMRADGTAERVDASEFSGYWLAGDFRIWERSKAPAYIGTDTPDCLSATVWAKDAKHAVKIVNEKRAEMIASGAWK